MTAAEEGKDLTIYFTNNSQKNVEVFWIDDQGLLTTHANLEPGGLWV
jgi:hypothetical protein